MLIIGGSSGIGFSVAEAALEHGAEVVISSSNQSKLDKAVARLQEHARAVGISAKISSATCDLANAETLDNNIVSLFEAATKDGKLDHVVFTAGDALPGPSNDVSVEDLYANMLMRQVAPSIIAKHIAKYVNSSSKSSLTLTSGTIAWRPVEGRAVVAGVGGAVEGLTRGLALDLRPIRVNCVQPGAVHTEFFQWLPQENLEAILDSMRKDTLLNQVGTPEEVAEAYIYAMKDTFTTGGVIESNGGRNVGSSNNIVLK